MKYSVLNSAALIFRAVREHRSNYMSFTTISLMIEVLRVIVLALNHAVKHSRSSITDAESEFEVATKKREKTHSANNLTVGAATEKYIILLHYWYILLIVKQVQNNVEKSTTS